MTIEAGEGYRLLKQGERIQVGDEYWSEAGWVYISIPSHFGEVAQFGTYRRKIEPQQSGWIPINGQYSSIQFPCWVADDKGVAFRESITDTSWATHWWPLKFPLLPPPAEDPSRTAFEAHVSKFIYPGENSAKQTDWELWQKAVAWQKEQKQ